MKRISIFAFLAVAVLSQESCKPKQPQNGGNDTMQTSTPPLPIKPEFASPEGAIFHGNHLYISNVGKKLEPTVKDGDGYIMRLDPTGSEWIDKEAFQAIKLNAPKGMATIGNQLYVADVDRVVAIDLEKIAVSWEMEFSKLGTSFLNDIAVKDDSTIYVSGTDVNAIIEINVNNQTYKTPKIKGLNGPNGLLYLSEGNKILCAEYGSEEAKGRLVWIDVGSNKVSPLGELRGSLDGIVMLRSGDFLVTDWDIKGAHRVSNKDWSYSTFKLDSIQGPADLGYNTATQSLAIPRMMENGLKIVKAE